MYKVSGEHGLDKLLGRINAGESVNIKDADGDSALILATYYDKPTVVEELLKDSELDPNIQDGVGWTALIWAAYYGNLRIVKMLLEDKRIDPNIKGLDGKTALMWAKDRGFKEIENLLLASYSKKIETVEDTGW